jgi:hypothetical protein
MTGLIVSLLCAHGEWDRRILANAVIPGRGAHENLALKIINLALLDSRSTNCWPFSPTISISLGAQRYVLQKYSKVMYLGSAKVPIVDEELRISNCGDDGGKFDMVRYLSSVNLTLGSCLIPTTRFLQPLLN